MKEQQTLSGGIDKTEVLYFNSLRDQFPALSKNVRGNNAIYFDGPGGTQVSRRVIDAISSYYSNCNANSGGVFATSVESDAITDNARLHMATLLNCQSNEIIFGANMTSLTFAASRALSRDWHAGDELITTALDHDANVAPWKALEEKGLKVHKVDFDVKDCTLDLADLAGKLNSKTKLVAVGLASNAVGTINDVEKIVEMAHSAGALTYIDAVHYAPHAAIDVQKINCDFLACSPYKFFAPHMGVLYAKAEVLARVAPYKVRPSDPNPPVSWETGTQSFELQSGLVAAIKYLEQIGAEGSESLSLQMKLQTAMKRIQNYERALSEHFVPKLLSIPAISFYGIAEKERFGSRTPTFGFNMRGMHPMEVCKHLADEGIFAWDGNFYAIGVTERLGLEHSGGMVRVGFVHYNTIEEIDRLLNCLNTIASRSK